MSAQPDRYGYVKKSVNDKKLRIKEFKQGTHASVVARRLLTDDRVDEVSVEHDGTVTIRLKDNDSFVVGPQTDLVPDGWEVERVHVHSVMGSFDFERASAHVDIVQK